MTTPPNPLPCGCVAGLNRIVFCPLHAAAGELLAACRLALPELVNEEAADSVRAAIAAAEPQPRTT